MKKALIAILVLQVWSCSKPQKTPFLTFSSDALSITKVELFQLKNGYTLSDVAAFDEDLQLWAFRSDTVLTGIFELRINDNKKIPLIISDAMPSAIVENKKELTIDGNHETQTLWKANQLVNQFEEFINKQASNFPDSLLSTDFEYHRDSVFRLIENSKNDCQSRIQLLIEKHSNSILPLLLVQLKAGNHLLFDYNKDAEIYYRIDELLYQKYANYQPVNNFHMRVDSLRRWMTYTSVSNPGRPLPDISVPNAWGDPIALSSFKDKNTLFVLWNSQNESSRIFTKQLRRWSRPYRLKGLEICMISLDTDKEKWKKAIKEDNLPYWHLSDLKGEKSAVYSDLGLNSLPTFLLVDKDGIIIAKNKDLNSLTNTLNEYF
ncbi:TlpA family protein disulfide reductase [Carboxylicivirga sp. N1Y90]|uniref:TlpA family protein disulfide reductase n=1 Tax=Carboxylicivirga fragile TaxID=3417571 RepID=UPI003D33B7CF|nr:TlpA family protein disulfide reductase [Marinilabiliaceae bacterium N1Y90]